MNKNTKSIVIALLSILTVFTILFIGLFSSIPDKLSMQIGEEYIYLFKNPFPVDFIADRSGYLSINNLKEQSVFKNINLLKSVSVKTSKAGDLNLSVKAFGFIPVKKMKIQITPQKEVVAVGSTIGVKIRTKGILVVAIGEFEDKNGKNSSPAKNAGIKAGDVIISANGKTLENIDMLTTTVNSIKKKPICFEVKSGNLIRKLNLTPKLGGGDNNYHLGIWVRDGMAGIGTITFYEKENGNFAALGHGIADIDTGKLFLPKNGEIYTANVIDIKKGSPGNPGELKGVFSGNNEPIGQLLFNSEFGIFGVLENEDINKLPGKLYPVATRTQIKPGTATILSNISGNEVNEYNINIEKISNHLNNVNKNMIVKVTDSDLLKRTGGIVQGMSGSPIIQNGRIVGAVTHVFINDPTRGYGIFIEKMLVN